MVEAHKLPLTNLNILDLGFVFSVAKVKTICIEHCEDAQVTDTFLEMRSSFYTKRMADDALRREWNSCECK